MYAYKFFIDEISKIPHSTHKGKEEKKLYANLNKSDEGKIGRISFSSSLFVYGGKKRKVAEIGWYEKRRKNEWKQLLSILFVMVCILMIYI